MLHKQLWILLLLFVLLAACGKQAETGTIQLQEGEHEMTTDEMYQVYRADEGRVRPLGRTLFLKDTRWLALSGSGVEFTLNGTKAEITLKGDQIALKQDNHARVGIYVNGQRVVDALLDEPFQTYTIFESASAQEVTVRVVKLSEAAMSTVGIYEIRAAAVDGIKPTPALPRRIEFIGDSITAGYGVDDEVKEHGFSTATEDVTRTYAYKTAAALQAEYSMVAYSGYGIISGYTVTDQKVVSQRVPDYYEKFARSEGRMEDLVNPSSVDWDFTQFVPDLIVINLGTNDDSYTKDDAAKQREYRDAYVDFLKQVRSRNPNAHMLCTLGIMGDRLFPMVEQAAALYAEETGDSNVSVMKFDVQSPADGYAADWHPTEATHSKAAEKLVARIREVMAW